MEESRGSASSPAPGMAEEPEAITHEAVRDPSEEWFISIFGVDSQQHDSEAGSKHRIQKVPAKFREYEKDKKYFDPRVVSLGPYHHGKDHLKPMEKHKITAVKRFVDDFIFQNGGRGGIYEKFMDLTRVLKECYDDEVVGNMSDEDFARMMFLDGCFVLHFIENINYEEAETILEISNDLIPLIIRDMFLIENQLPFEVLDALMNLRWGSSSSEKPNIVDFIKLKVLIPMGFSPLNYFRLLSISSEKRNIVDFIKLKVLIPMGFYPLNYFQWFFEWFRELDILERGSPLHLLDILRTILLDSPTWEDMDSYRPLMEFNEIGNRFENRLRRNFGSVVELEETMIRIEKGNMTSLMDISYKENLLFPQLLLPTMFINDTTISQLLNLTAFEADIYSGWGVTSYILFMDSLINDKADVKMLRSKGILHHSLVSDNEVARLFNQWPADMTNDLKKYRDISIQILRHRNRTVKISIATWVDKYFGSAWTAFSFAAAVLLLFLATIQTYFAALSGR